MKQSALLVLSGFVYGRILLGRRCIAWRVIVTSSAEFHPKQ
jgi:ABC-type uncharacterized transport system permease subunit